MQEGLAKASTNTGGVSNSLAVCLLTLTNASARVAVTAQSAQPDTYYCYIASVNFHRFPFQPCMFFLSDCLASPFMQSLMLLVACMQSTLGLSCKLQAV